MKFLIVIESTANGFSAYAPDVPGCIATGASREIAERDMTTALAFHVAGLCEEGHEVPQASTSAAYVDVAM